MNPRFARTAALALSLSACGARTGVHPLDASTDAPPPPDANVDASTDAYAPDAAPDCRADADCDDGLACTDDRCVDGVCAHEGVDTRCEDGLFCNGHERCDVGVGCVSPGRLCDDTIPCTVDACDEARDRCVATPDDSRCPLSYRCDGTLDCVARALVHDATNLYEVDLPGGELNPIGRFPIELTDIALAPDGTFYGAAPGALVRVDYVSVTYEVVASITGSFNSLDISPDGTIYGASSDAIVRFDLAGGFAVDVARLAGRATASGDIAFLEGVLYETVSPSTMSTNDDLYVVDVDAGTATRIGPIGFDCVWGLAPLGATLYGLTCEGRLLQIDVTTGAGTELSRRTGQEFWGAASR